MSAQSETYTPVYEQLADVYYTVEQISISMDEWSTRSNIETLFIICSLQPVDVPRAGVIPLVSWWFRDTECSFEEVPRSGVVVAKFEGNSFIDWLKDRLLNFLRDNVASYKNWWIRYKQALRNINTCIQEFGDMRMLTELRDTLQIKHQRLRKGTHANLDILLMRTRAWLEEYSAKNMPGSRGNTGRGRPSLNGRGGVFRAVYYTLFKNLPEILRDFKWACICADDEFLVGSVRRSSEALLQHENYVWERTRRIGEAEISYWQRIASLNRKESSIFADNETRQRNTVLSEEITARKLITKKLEQAIQQEARRVAEEAKAEQLRIERARQAEEQRIEQESKAEQRRAAQERTRIIQERRRVEQAVIEERRQAERQRQTYRRLEIIRAERERLPEQRPRPSPHQSRTNAFLPEQPHPSTIQLLTRSGGLRQTVQIQPAEQSELSDNEDPQVQMERIHHAEKHAQDNNCIRMVLIGEDGSSVVEAFFPIARYNDYKATFLIPRIGLDLYRYLTSFEDASKPTCNICLDASGSFGCGRNSGGKNCEGALCWECFHTFFVRDKLCPLCRLEYIPLGDRVGASSTSGFS
jgi:hypothetical protein